MAASVVSHERSGPIKQSKFSEEQIVYAIRQAITVDHGTEFQSRALEDWAYRRGVQLDFIRPGKPVENAFIESFNGRLRDECLTVHQCASLAEAQTIIEAWWLDYNQRRPHSSLGHLTPNEFVMQRQAEQIAEEVVCSSEEPSQNGANVRSQKFSFATVSLTGKLTMIRK